MALVRADLGTPTRTVCTSCRSDQALRHPIVLITSAGVEVEPWVLITCRDCGALGKQRTTT